MCFAEVFPAFCRDDRYLLKIMKCILGKFYSFSFLSRLCAGNVDCSIKIKTSKKRALTRKSADKDF